MVRCTGARHRAVKPLQARLPIAPSILFQRGTPFLLLVRAEAKFVEMSGQLRNEPSQTVSLNLYTRSLASILAVLGKISSRPERGVIDKWSSVSFGTG